VTGIQPTCLIYTGLRQYSSNYMEPRKPEQLQITQLETGRYSQCGANTDRDVSAGNVTADATGADDTDRTQAAETIKVHKADRQTFEVQQCVAQTLKQTTHYKSV
jgi:hypothetical protein